MKSHNVTALAVGATAAIGALALLSVLRADSMKRRIRDGAERAGTRSQIGRWDGEGGHIARDLGDADDEQGSGLGHA